MQLLQCFSILLASGQGNKCAILKNILQQELLLKDKGSIEPKVFKHKFEKLSDPEGHKKLRIALAKKIIPLFSNVDRYFFGSDLKKQDTTVKKSKFIGKINQIGINSPVLLDAKNIKHVILFRRMLEISMSRGLWAGLVGHD